MPSVDRGLICIHIPTGSTKAHESKKHKGEKHEKTGEVKALLESEFQGLKACESHTHRVVALSWYTFGVLRSRP